MDERNGNHIKIYVLQTIDFIVFLSSKSPKKVILDCFLKWSREKSDTGKENATPEGSDEVENENYIQLKASTSKMWLRSDGK